MKSDRAEQYERLFPATSGLGLDTVGGHHSSNGFRPNPAEQRFAVRFPSGALVPGQVSRSKK